MLSKSSVLLIAAIVAEVIATTALAKSEGFAKLYPSIIAIVGYVAAYWLLSYPLQVIPTGVVYAVWSGVGIVLITAVAWIWLKQTLDLPALIGLVLILAGVITINLFSRTMSH